MGYNPIDNLTLPADEWIRITELSGIFHFKYDPSTTIYIYEGHGNPPVDIPSPDIHEPVMVLNAGHKTGAKVGHTMKYVNRVGAIWAFSEGDNSAVLKVHRDIGEI